ncbi:MULTISPECIES: hypothetical protein [unclassified Sinorhizobium]|uniref:hypothetical protein n=1 Tax=unclassified Sinorhizobium TaxID=2613772 RepID=UPI0035241C65
MKETHKSTTQPPVHSAEELRKQALEKRLAEMEREKNKRMASGEDLAEFTEDFFRKHVGDSERAMIRRMVMNAVADGKMEAMVYSFPSSFCIDGGRAINNFEPDWPNTLQGKAKEIYDLFTKVAEPEGYKLRAMVIDFPGGIPGDIGFFLNWEASGT